MPVLRLAKWSAVGLVALSVGLSAQEPSTQQLYETGQYQALVDRAAEGRAASPDDTYMAALAFLKMENSGASAAEYRRLQEQGGAWGEVGASGVAMLEHNYAEAVAAAQRAAGMSGDHPYIQYQLGLSAAGANDFGTSSQAFGRATELKPDFAYAHYYAGQAFQKVHDLAKAAEHYNAFMRLAPDSPDRGAVMAILRSMRK
jgi:tetratricopeptide (TPR) repeat protein